jgi:hypothetical protein
MKHAALLTLVVVCLAAVARGQTQQPQTTFRASVDVVRVPAVVTDGTHAVSGLTAADFELLDSNVLQKIAVTPLEAQPVDVTLVLDVSGSVQGHALNELRADVQKIAGSLQPADRVRLITFGDDVRDVFGYLSGGAPLPVDRIAGGGVTSLYEGLAAALMADPGIERPQLVFALTDGRDNASFFDAKRIASLASTTPASLYLAIVDPSQPLNRFDDAKNPLSTEQSVITYAERKGSVYEQHQVVRRAAGPYTGPPEMSALKAAVARTGGALYEKVRDSLPERFMHALDDFRSGYLLSYSPTGVPASGWHEVTVRVKNPRDIVRARGGYMD